MALDATILCLRCVWRQVAAWPYLGSSQQENPTHAPSRFPHPDHPNHRRLPRSRPRHGRRIPEEGLERHRHRPAAEAGPCCTTWPMSIRRPGRDRDPRHLRTGSDRGAARPSVRPGLRHVVRQRRRHQQPRRNHRGCDDRGIRPGHGHEFAEPDARPRKPGAVASPRRA